MNFSHGSYEYHGSVIENTRKSVQEKPLGGRLVLFDSRRVLHEVRPNASASDRLALTVWIGGSSTAGGFLRHCRDYLGWLAAVT